MRSLLLYDVSYQVHRAVHAHPKLTCGDTFTGGLYGFFQTLGKVARETEATRIAFCVDMPPYIRSKSYPQYKMIRKKAQDAETQARVAASKVLVLQALMHIGANVHGLAGFESDDHIAAIALRQRHRFDRIYAGSNDSDLWQHLDIRNFALYVTDIGHLVTRKSLDAFKLTPSEYMLMTAMTGTHNDVAGIPNVGPVNATKAIRDPALMRKWRASHGDLIDRNLALIKLPHQDLPPECGNLQDAPVFDPRAIYRALGRYDIDVTQPMVRAFEQTAR